MNKKPEPTKYQKYAVAFCVLAALTPPIPYIFNFNPTPFWIMGAVFLFDALYLSSVDRRKK